MVAGFLKTDSRVELALDILEVYISESDAYGSQQQSWQVHLEGPTKILAILGEESMAQTEIDKTTNCVARAEFRTIRFSHVLGGKAMPIIAVVAP